MYLSGRKLHQLQSVIDNLTSSRDSVELRTKAAAGLLELLDADYLASYVWDARRQRFRSRVCLNMNPSNLERYEAYYQFHDPITFKLQERQTATPVSQVMPQRDLRRTEFFNDFLKADGLHFGINVFAWHDGQNVGDLRIWRGRRGEDFGANEAAILNYLLPCFRNVMFNASQASVPLTLRERDVLHYLQQGLPDKEIARKLDISFSTVRTHLNHLFEKFAVSNRTDLVRQSLEASRPAICSPDRDAAPSP